jgi:hypothetical protein
MIGSGSFSKCSLLQINREIVLLVCIIFQKNSVPDQGWTNIRIRNNHHRSYCISESLVTIFWVKNRTYIPCQFSDVDPDPDRKILIRDLNGKIQIRDLDAKIQIRDLDTKIQIRDGKIKIRNQGSTLQIRNTGKICEILVSFVTYRT